MKLVCPHCNTQLRLKQAVAEGKKVRCPRCTSVFAAGTSEPKTRPVEPARRREIEADRGDNEDRDENGLAAPERSSSRRSSPERSAPEWSAPQRPAQARRSLLPLIAVGALLLVAGGGFLAWSLLNSGDKAAAPAIAKAPADKSAGSLDIAKPETAKQGDVTSPPRIVDTAPLQPEALPPPKILVGAAEPPPEPPQPPVVQKPKKTKSPPPRASEEKTETGRDDLPAQVQQDLRELLSSKDAERRAQALRTLDRAGPRGEALLPEMYKAFVDDDAPLVRLAAAQALGKLQGLAAAAVPGLEQTVADPGEEGFVRQEALVALGMIGQAGVPRLLASLSSEEPYLREAALRGLAHAKPREKEATEKIAALATDPTDKVSTQALRTLRAFDSREPAVAQALGKVLQSKNSTLRSEALLTLAQMREAGAPALPQLIECLNDADPAEFTRLFSTLRALGPQAKQAVPALSALGARTAASGKPKIGLTITQLDPGNPSAVPLLIAGLSQTSKLESSNSARALAYCGPAGKEAVPGLLQGGRVKKEPFSSNCDFALACVGKDAVPALVGELKSKDSAARTRAASILARMGQQAADALPELVVALKDPEENVRQNALKALEGLGALAKSAAADVLPLLKDPKYGVRQRAGHALAWIGVPEADRAALIAQALARGPDYEISRLALPGAGDAGIDALKKLTEQKNKADQLAAKTALAVALGKQSIERAMPSLQSPNADTRYQAAAEIVKANPCERQAMLIVTACLTDDADPAKRLQAAKLLGTLPKFTDDLGTVIIPLARAMNESSPEVREAAAAALSSLDSVGYKHFVPPARKSPLTKGLPPVPARDPLYAKLPARTRPLVGQVAAAAELPIECPLRLYVPRDAGQGRPVAVFDRVREDGSIKDKSARGILARELVRQALAIAARDELGLAVRDLSLSESFAGDAGYELKGELFLTCGFESGKRVGLALVRKAGGKQDELWKKDVPLGKTWDYARLAEDMEALSRTEWPAVLRRAGFAGLGPAKKSADKPAVNEDRLEVLSEFALVTAIRDAHIQMRGQGESPEMLGQLVRAYANLGLLTEHHWTATHKIAKARALLYAQRLLAQRQAAAASWWHRAYAMAILGRHDGALADLAAAAKLAAPAKETPPSWVGVLDAYCRFDLGRLEELGNASALARLLHFGLVADGTSSTRTVSVGQDLLKVHPDCYRAWDALSSMRELGVLHHVTEAAPAHLAGNLTRNLRALPRLPGGVAELLTDEPLTPAQERRLLQALTAASALGQDDDGLSWSAVAALVRETRFAQVFRRLEFMLFRWSVPVGEFWEEAQPWVADHPYYGFLAIHTKLTPDEVKAAGKAVTAKIDVSALAVGPTVRLVTYIDGLEENRATRRGTRLTVAHGDLVYRDVRIALGPIATRPLVIGQKSVVLGAKVGPSVERQVALARQLLEVSPHSTFARAALIELDWDKVRNQAADWEKTQDSDVLGYLGRRYLELGRLEDGQRCLGKYLEKCPEHWAFLAMADSYKHQNDDARWLATLEKFLELPSLGLEQARVQVDIATYYRQKKDKDKALDYAEAAAETWAEWAMRLACACNEDVQNWERAEMWVRRVSERYPSAAKEWQRWCERTGMGDLKAATELAMGRATETVTSAADALHDKAWTALSARQWKAAAESFRKLQLATRDQSLHMFAALAADAHKDTDQRDGSLRKVPADNRFGKVAALFREALKPKAQLDLDMVDKSLADERPAMKADVHFLVGWFLELRGHKDQALVYYDRCATAAAGRPTLRALAIQAVREAGMEPGRVRKKD